MAKKTKASNRSNSATNPINTLKGVHSKNKPERKGPTAKISQKEKSRVSDTAADGVRGGGRAEVCAEGRGQLSRQNLRLKKGQSLAWSLGEDGADLSGRSRVWGVRSEVSRMG